MLFRSLEVVAGAEAEALEEAADEVGEVPLLVAVAVLESLKVTP